MASKKTISMILLTILLGACAQYENQRGVEVSWQAAALSEFRIGSTNRSEVLTKLGPPSQLISLGDETVLYYLYERSVGDGLILMVYNRFNVDTRYDRAVFFFDDNDILTDFASYIARAADS
ncbi:MAG: outer membrane protein assembly factor BamE (lipoprotein component of BamABCDE complex) [Alcanivorax sp.]|jgi:outer membrane protein assembly factor BamE (lipoprotein component of BamABCDE complex)